MRNLGFPARLAAVALAFALLLSQTGPASAKARLVVIYPISSSSDLAELAHELTGQLATKFGQIDGFDARVATGSQPAANHDVPGVAIYVRARITALPLGVHLDIMSTDAASGRTIATEGYDLINPWIPSGLDMSALVGAGADASGPASDPNLILVPTGTEVDIAIDSVLSSASAKVDDTFSFHALRNVQVGDNVVITRGAHGQGEVVDVETAGSNGHPGRIVVRYDWIVSVDGLKVPLSSTQQQTQGADKRGAASTATIASYLLLGGLGLFAHNFVRGNDVTIEPTTALATYTDRSVHVAASAAPLVSVPVGFAR
jgi:hypothetical protein